MIRLGSRSVCLRNHLPQVVRFALPAAILSLRADTTAYDHERRPSVELRQVLHAAAVPEKLRLGVTIDVLANLGEDTAVFKANIKTILGEGSFPEEAAGIVEVGLRVAQVQGSLRAT